MMTTLRTWYWRHQFAPGWIGIVINPFYFARRGLLKGLREFFPLLGRCVLDVGCGRKPYRRYIPATEYVGVDIDTVTTRALGVADVLYDGKTLPFPDASFDGVLCSQVLEHVFEPDAFLTEIHRVLRPGGVVLLATPFVWDEHEQPYDFGRYSSFGLRAVFERNGFRVVEQRKTAEGVATCAQLTIGYVYKLTRTRVRIANLLAQFLLIAPLTILGLAAAALLPRHSDLYLDNIILARKGEGQATRP